MSEEEFKNICSNSKSIADVLRSSGFTQIVGGNYYTVKKYLQKYNINTSHWTGQGWSKNKQLKNWSDYNRSSECKKHLLVQRTHKCEMCTLTEWMKNPISLELHHIDGNRTNNTYENLQLLCPNCHSLTDTWRGRNSKKLE